MSSVLYVKFPFFPPFLAPFSVSVFVDQCWPMGYAVSVLPGIAFSLHLIQSTGQYGVSEVLVSSFMASFIFSVIGAQPLCIAGVTGL